MNASGTAPDAKRPAGILSVRRVLTTLAFAALGGLLLSPGWEGGARSVIITRTAPIGLLAMLTFGVLERWPRRLPRGLARWVLQVVAVGLCAPAGAFALYAASTPAGSPPFWQVPSRATGFMNVSMLGVLLAPWVALGALVRQKDALARHQALEFELKRTELERHALEARLRLVQAQVTPHFLFNTLSNVQALVDARSPRASEVLHQLIVYLRAAVPRLDEPTRTIGDELQLVRVYLELMHMRMPQRLQFDIDADPDALALRCPSLALLTLVENAVRHGIDASEEGGCIEVRVGRHGDHWRVLVRDTGVGMRDQGRGLGTGLAALRERLALMYGDEAKLSVVPDQPRGVRAELDLPSAMAVRS